MLASREGPVRRLAAEARGRAREPLELGMFLGKFFKDPKGPGEVFTGSPQLDSPVGLVAPHIDFFRGGPHYAWAYGELAKHRPPDLIVALGVAHVSPRSPWVLTLK